MQTEELQSEATVSGAFMGGAVTPGPLAYGLPGIGGCGLSLAFVCCSAGLDVGSLVRTGGYN